MEACRLLYYQPGFPPLFKDDLRMIQLLKRKAVGPGSGRIVESQNLLP